MSLDRRDFLGLMAGAAIATKSRGARAAAPGKAIRAVAFDAFPVLDPRPVFALVEELYPTQGKALSQAWLTRQFEYQWLRALSGQYADFWKVTEDALRFAARSLDLDLPASHQAALMNSYLELRAWPDVGEALETLRGKNIRLAFLSNATPAILNAGLRNSGLQQLFSHVLSTDQIRSYKPAPRAYQMALDAFGLSREEIAFAAFAGWDVAGAVWFGYPTYWVNRRNQPLEMLDAAPAGSGSGLQELVDFILARNG